MYLVNRIFIKLLIVFFGLLLFSVNASAQTDSLVLYTKISCSNCMSVKQALNASSIGYIEKGLENNQFAQEMLSKLRSKGYHGTINLPVIFLNNKILHPTYEKDSSFVSVPLNQVIDSIKQKVLNGTLHLKNLTKETMAAENEIDSQSSDCEVEHNPIYLICQSFNTVNDANEYKSRLILQGYSFAGVLFYKNQYHVYCKFFLDQTVAQNAFPSSRKQFPQAYLFQIPKD